MTRSEIITKLKQYFDIRELVCPHVYGKYKDRSWKFLDTNLLHTLLVLREGILCVPLTINTYHKGGIYDERGNRCNMCDITRNRSRKGIMYLSGHVFFKAFDVIPKGMTADKGRALIVANADKLPVPVRLESGTAAPTWIHVDVMDDEDNQKVTIFKP